MAVFPENLNGDAYLVGDGATSKIFIGVKTTQKISLYGVAPVVQPADAGQDDPGVMTTVNNNTGTAGAGLSLISATDTTDQSSNIMNDLVALQEDIVALDVLLTEVRSCLVNLGAMKGSA